MPLDYPYQSYFPSAKLRLTIRFDEFGQTSLLSPPPRAIVKNLNGIAPPKAALQVIADPAAPPGVTRYLLSPVGSSSAALATSQSSSSDGMTYDVTVIPKEMVWMINGLRTASTLTAAVKLRDCPLDPRTIRSCAVEAFMGGVSAEDYRDGIEGGLRDGQTISGQGAPFNCLPDNYVDQDGNNRTNSRFLGWVDKWAIEWMKDQEPCIHLDCRDNTQLLIEQDASVNVPLDMTKPLDIAVATYLTNFNQLQGMSVQFLPTTDTPPVLNTVLNNTAYRPQLGPQAAKNGGAPGKLSVWDYLTDVCGAVGCAVRVDGTTLIIQRPRSLVSSTSGARPDDPYQGRTLPSGLSLPYRTFIYGRNILEMHTSRSFVKANAPINIEVRSYSTESKKLLVARWPLNNVSNPNAGRMVAAIPGNAQPEQKWLEFRVPEIKDLPTLTNIAQTIYEQLGRNELTVEVKTNNQSSFGGGNLDPDIFDMKFGDTFEVLTNQNPADETNTFNFIESQLNSAQLNSAYMQSLGFSAQFAEAYAKAYTNVGLQTLFRMKQLKASWNIATGYDFHLVGINYIEARANRAQAPGLEPGSPAPTQQAPTSDNVSQAINGQ